MSVTAWVMSGQLHTDTVGPPPSRACAVPHVGRYRAVGAQSFGAFASRDGERESERRSENVHINRGGWYIQKSNDTPTAKSQSKERRVGVFVVPAVPFATPSIHTQVCWHAGTAVPVHRKIYRRLALSGLHVSCARVVRFLLDHSIPAGSAGDRHSPPVPTAAIALCHALGRRCAQLWRRAEASRAEASRAEASRARLRACGTMGSFGTLGGSGLEASADRRTCLRSQRPGDQLLPVLGTSTIGGSRARRLLRWALGSSGQWASAGERTEAGAWP